MRSWSTCPRWLRCAARSSVGFVLACAAACDAPVSIDQESNPITVDPNCNIGSMALYPNINFAGTPICVYGFGTLVLPKSFDTRSYASGVYWGCFKTPPWERHFEPIENVANAPYVVVNSSTVTIQGAVDPHADASGPGWPPPCP